MTQASPPLDPPASEFRETTVRGLGPDRVRIRTAEGVGVATAVVLVPGGIVLMAGGFDVAGPALIVLAVCIVATAWWTTRGAVAGVALAVREGGLLVAPLPRPGGKVAVPRLVPWDEVAPPGSGLDGCLRIWWLDPPGYADLASRSDAETDAFLAAMEERFRALPESRESHADKRGRAERRARRSRIIPVLCFLALLGMEAAGVVRHGWENADGEAKAMVVLLGAAVAIGVYRLFRGGPATLAGPARG